MSSHIFVSVLPASTVLTDIYTVPAGQRGDLRIVATNRGSDTAIRVSVAPGGAADEAKQYTVYDMILPANDAYALAPVLVPAGAVFRAASASGSVAFHCTGMIREV